MDNNEADKIRIQNPESRITVLDGITSLLDNNLLVLLSEEPDNSGDARLRMLEVVREFAREALRESGELESACRRHARFFMALAEQAEPHLLSARAVEWLDKLEDEIDNLRAALRWALRAEPETAVKIASATLQFWIFRSYLTEGREWLNAALAQSAAAASSSSAAGGGSQAEMRLNLFHGLGILARIQGDYAAAREIYEQYLAESRAAGNDRRLALSSNGLGTILRLQGERSAARECFEEGLRLSRRSNDPKAVAYSLLCLGIALGLDGEPTRARRLLEESLTILREFGNKEAISNNLNNLGSVAFDEGDYDAARRYFTEGLRISREVGNKVNITDALNGLGALAAERGDFRTAAELAGAAEALSQSIGFSREPAEKAFCDTYIAKTRANLSDENFAEAFESGRAGSLETALALAEGKFRSGEEDQFAEIVIEERSFSRVVIEEEEEIAEPAEKNITPRRNV
jgi:tetratricopeptide (TPR) repeat protein